MADGVLKLTIQDLADGDEQHKGEDLLVLAVVQAGEAMNQLRKMRP